MEELISIIIPAYNLEHEIVDCLNSVLSQTYANFEIIIIDDGSVDGTCQICCEFEKKDCRVKVIRQENKGVSAARNRGIETAKGKYIAFIDGDDVMMPDFLKTLHDDITSSDADIAMCGFVPSYDKTAILPRGSNALTLYDQRDGIIDLLCFNNHTVALWNKLYKKELWDNIRFDTTLKKGEDLKANFLVFNLCSKSIYRDENLYLYYKRPGSETMSEFSEKNIDNIMVGKYIYQCLLNNELIKPYALSRYLYYIVSTVKECAKSHMSKDEKKKIKKIIKKELKEINLFSILNLVKINTKVSMASLLLYIIPF